MFGVGRNVPNTSRVLLESLAWGLWASQGLGVPLVPLGPGCELAAAPGVTQLCLFAL